MLGLAVVALAFPLPLSLLLGVDSVLSELALEPAGEDVEEVDLPEVLKAPS